ncbi:hypothetical protein GQ42DRAFT_168326 [Ramicandelaber brevisporus]|nr:hypothetical protein GQ42DRAFT_168326 [Ramicandelaber brevisporus]
MDLFHKSFELQAARGDKSELRKNNKDIFALLLHSSNKRYNPLKKSKKTTNSPALMTRLEPLKLALVATFELLGDLTDGTVNFPSDIDAAEALVDEYLERIVQQRDSAEYGSGSHIAAAADRKATDASASASAQKSKRQKSTCSTARNNTNRRGRD